MIDRYRIALNDLQYHIDRSSDEVLLIFENEWSIDHFMKERKKDITNYELPNDYFDNLTLITLAEFASGHGLTGRRFREYRFMPL